MSSSDYRLAAIMFTDIVGFSRMMEQNEAETLQLLSSHNRLVADAIGEYNGTIIKSMGDGFLVDFPNTVQAVQAGVTILDRMHAWNVTRGGSRCSCGSVFIWGTSIFSMMTPWVRG